LVVVIVFIIDQIFDNYISPKIMGRTIGVHPAALLIAAIVSFSLLGIVGVFLAAPGLATLILFGRYIIRKMFDLDPWPEQEDNYEKVEFPWVKWWEKISAIKKAFQNRLKRKDK
jgi:predicted PurR-regulated permease PerM